MPDKQNDEEWMRDQVDAFRIRLADSEAEPETEEDDE